MGILVAALLSQSDFKWFSRTAAVLPVLLMIAMLVLNLGKADERSDRIIFNQINTSAPVFYIEKRPFSGQFYSQGKAKLLQETEELSDLDEYYLIGKKHSVDPVLNEQRLSCLTQFISKSGRALYHCKADNEAN